MNMMPKLTEPRDALEASADDFSIEIGLFDEADCEDGHRLVLPNRYSDNFVVAIEWQDERVSGAKRVELNAGFRNAEPLGNVGDQRCVGLAVNRWRCQSDFQRVAIWANNFRRLRARVNV